MAWHALYAGSLNNLLRILVSTSVVMMNKVGDKGSLYFSTLGDEKKPKSCPFIITRKQSYHHIYNSLWKSKFPKYHHKVCQDSLSYAFIISNFTIILWNLFLLLISLTISSSSSTFSIILLPFINPYWFFEYNTW